MIGEDVAKAEEMLNAPAVSEVSGFQELLEQEGVSDFDAFVSLGSRDEENLMTGLYAAKRGVKKVIAKNNRVSYLELIDGLGLDSIVSPKDITTDTILRYVRGRVNGQGTSVEKLYKLVNGQAEALEFTAKAGAPYLGKRLMDLKLTEGAIIAVIVRMGKVIVPFGNDHIEADDTILVITRKTGITDLNEVILR